MADNSVRLRVSWCEHPQTTVVSTLLCMHGTRRAVSHAHVRDCTRKHKEPF